MPCQNKIVLIAKYHRQISKYKIGQKKKPKGKNNHTYNSANHPKAKVGEHHPNYILQKTLFRSPSTIIEIYVVNNQQAPAQNSQKPSMALRVNAIQRYLYQLNSP